VYFSYYFQSNNLQGAEPLMFAELISHENGWTYGTIDQFLTIDISFQADIASGRQRRGSDVKNRSS
jgi:hypothetical protein